MTSIREGRRRVIVSLAAASVALALGLLPAESARAQQINKGGTLVVALPGDVEVINSSITTDISSSNMCGQVYSTIVRLDDNGNVQPYLAKSWEISPDGLTYTFRFFDNIKWHDGVPFTSEDVAWGLWNVNKKYNGPASGLLDAVEKIDTPDKLTAVFRLKYPYPPLLRGLAYFNSSTIIPKHIFDNGEDPRKNPANLKPIGTGPFVFKEYRKGSHVAFERNPNFHLEGRPYLDRVVFQVVPNEASRSLGLEKGDIDFIPYYAMSLAEVERLKSNPKIKIAIAKRQIAGEYMAFLNTRNPPLDKKEVRQALYFGMDRADMLDKAGFGFGKVSAGPISSEQPTFYTDKVPTYTYDPAKAEAMLDAAGLPKKADGFRFPLRISFSNTEGPMNNVARLMKAQFARIGVDLKIMGMDPATWRDSAFRNWDFDVTMGSYATGPDPAIGAETFYICKRIEKIPGRNASGYCNPKLDETFATAAKELDETKRASLYHEVQGTLAADVPHWWLWDRYYPVAFRADFVGLPGDPTGYGAFDGVYQTK
jgi:peptide/nickel transport system substrate-binding protein